MLFNMNKVANPEISCERSFTTNTDHMAVTMLIFKYTLHKQLKGIPGFTLFHDKQTKTLIIPIVHWL